VTQQKAVVERYTDGLRKGDLAPILTCLTDDVVWALHGAKTLVGKDAFGGGRQRRCPQSGIDVGPFDRRGEHGRGGREWQRLAGGLVSRLDSFHIWLGEVPA
jgi:hypothetical protein